ncbi:MAG: hypothetical protein ABFR90_08595 [Planctomycetota bacterium]
MSMTLHFHYLESQTGFAVKKTHIHQTDYPDNSFLRPGISQNLSPKFLSPYSSIHPVFGLGKVKTHLPFALPDKIDVLETLLATCLPQVDSPAHFKMYN